MTVFLPSKGELSSLAAFLAALFFAKLVLHLLTLRLFRRKSPATSDAHFKSLKQVYAQVRPMLPEPNELIELSKSTGKTIEDLNSWFRTMRAHERSLVVASRLSEAVWRLAMLALSVGLVLDLRYRVTNVDLNARQVQLLRGCIHLHLLGLHLLSVRSMPFAEFLIVGFEMVVRFGLVAFSDNKLSELVTLTHDSTDALLEFSKFVDLIGLPNVAKLVFVMFAGAWVSLKSYFFISELVKSGYVSGAVPLAELRKRIASDQVLLYTYMGILAQISFDIGGLSTIFSISRAAFWAKAVPARRSARGDSLSSVTSLDYESDSSISSTLRGDPLKED